MSLSVENISYEYAKGTTLSHRALEDISIVVHPGESTLVIGSTGSGKSTLLRIVAGLIKPDKGSVTCDGAPVEAGRVGMVFQQPESQLFAEAILEDIAFGPLNLGIPYDEARKRAEDALARVGLDVEEFKGRSPFSLSGGQARRVAIAGILAMRPPYIVLDEPTAGLDGEGRAFIERILADLRADGTGVIVVSHDVDEFLPKVDYVVLLSERRIVWKGPAHELIGNPRIFSRASLPMPDLLAFQEHLGCMNGSYSFNVDRIATWALGGYSVGGPAGHIHAEHGVPGGED